MSVSRRNLLKIGGAAVGTAAGVGVVGGTATSALALTAANVTGKGEYAFLNNSDLNYLGGGKGFLYGNHEFPLYFADGESDIFYQIEVWTPWWDSNVLRSNFVSYDLSLDEDGSGTWERQRNLSMTEMNLPSLEKWDVDNDLVIKTHGWEPIRGQWKHKEHYLNNEMPEMYGRFLAVDDGYVATYAYSRPDLPEETDFVTPPGRRYESIEFNLDRPDVVTTTWQVRYFNTVGGEETTFGVFDIYLDDKAGWRRFMRRVTTDSAEAWIRAVAQWGEDQNTAEAKIDNLSWMTEKMKKLRKALQCSCMAVTSGSDGGVAALPDPVRRERLAGHMGAGAMLTGPQNFHRFRTILSAGENVQGLFDPGETGMDPHNEGNGWRWINVMTVPQASLARVRASVTQGLQLLDDVEVSELNELEDRKTAEKNKDADEWEEYWKDGKGAP